MSEKRSETELGMKMAHDWLCVYGGYLTVFIVHMQADIELGETAVAFIHELVLGTMR